MIFKRKFKDPESSARVLRLRCSGRSFAEPRIETPAPERSETTAGRAWIELESSSVEDVGNNVVPSTGFLHLPATQKTVRRNAHCSTKALSYRCGRK